MINTKLTRIAMKIAYEAHKDQVDKAGVPYIYHPIHVAENMDDEISTICALLHDVVEDTNVSFDDLSKYFSNDIISVLKLLTKDKNIDYMEYIKNIKTNSIATKVKIADLKHNSDESRLDIITEKDIIRNEKYQKALSYLME